MMKMNMKRKPKDVKDIPHSSVMVHVKEIDVMNMEA
jgi:hypothetical protein